MSDSPVEKRPGSEFTEEEGRKLAELKKQYLFALEMSSLNTLSFVKEFIGLTEDDAWKHFQRKYDPNKPGLAPFDRVAARKHQELYQKAEFNIKDGDIDCQWHTDLPPGLQGLKHTIHPPSWQIKWAVGSEDWIILRITKRNPDGSLVLEEVIGKRK